MKFTAKCLINFHYRSIIIKFTAIIRCAEYCHKVSASKKFVAIFNNLMGTTYKFDFMLFTKLFDDILAENIAYSSFIFSPTS